MRRVLHILLLLVFIVLLSLVLLPNNSILSNHPNEECNNPTKVEDYSNKKERLVVCADSIKYGEHIVTDKESMPDIFRYRFSDEEIWEPQYETVIYTLDGNQYVAIFPVINPQTWYIRAGYIFQKEKDEFKLIFERDFESLTGRWTGVRFEEKGSIFDPKTIVINQDLGYMGGQVDRILWTDYYEWDDTKKGYVLANNKQEFNNKKMLETYNQQDIDACKNETSDLNAKNITELFPIRGGLEYFCSDDSLFPYITGGQATIFLKAKKALEENIQGANHSYTDIEKI